ncbi:BAG domain-containing protein Samui [Ischnura elegans]|uniref:BAG domain-containing protein Samui n=1 Tax=Ischnura elegans TaxID=197161 RepID=UPI001ED8BBAA|nr:BAG domain-containing protein Samui [Ischnura elegans]
MSFSFRDKGRLSDRLRGKTCDEIIKELRDHLHQDRGMSFDSSPSWGGFSSSPAFARAGFPFMDQDMMSGPDMRAHFADLANRHPEFAEHLRPSTWNTAPETDPHFFHSTASGPSSYRQRHSSGGSGSGSYGEGEAIPIPVIHEDSGGGEPNSSRSRTRKIPQYGLRNTVDLGESQKSAAANDSEGDSRSQRSWSAPPDNRTQAEAPQPKRFVTKVDVNNSPANPTSGSESDAPVGPASNTSSPGGKPPPFPKPPGAPQAPQSTSKSGNVRHIPIFVEGRDEPILPKTQERQSFSSSHTASGFGQPNSSFSYASATPGSHASAFASSQSPAASTRSQSSAPHPQASGPFPRPTGPFSHPSAPFSHPNAPFSHPSAPHPQARTPHPQQSAPQKPKNENLPPQPPPQPPKPTLPKDPIARVKAIQEEVNELKKKVERFSGSRSDKEYIYLDEMLTRNLLKLDDIETEGKDSIRQARKEAIRSIEKCISVLESKAPLPQETKGGETGTTQVTDVMMEDSSGAEAPVEPPDNGFVPNGEANDSSLEPMEIQQKLGDQQSNNAMANVPEMKIDESSQAETPMEVIPDANNEKVIHTTSEPASKPVDSAQNAELMEVVAESANVNGSQDATSQEHELSKTEVQVSGGEGSDTVPGETVSSEGVNNSCDASSNNANNDVNVSSDAATAETGVNIDVGANKMTEQGKAASNEMEAVAESAVKDGDSKEAPSIKSESVEESKDSTTVASEEMKVVGEASVIDAPPVDTACKEGSS